jgi:outer membrane protein OmpA-like peptidoglycan-associated protein
VLAALAVAAPAHGQSAADAPQVLDLVLTVVSLDGSVKTDESVDKVEVTLGADVLFDFDEASLKPAARSRLAEAAERIRAGRPAKVDVVGYTDAKGSAGYNRRLSERRARAVGRALRRALGASTPALRIRGRGEADPVAPNTKEDGSDNPRGRAKNRRVTVSFSR